MSRGNENGGPHLPQSDGGQTGESVSRRRGRPPRQVQVAVAYRPQDSEEEKQIKEAVRLLLREMVCKRMEST